MYVDRNRAAKFTGSEHFERQLLLSSWRSTTTLVRSARSPIQFKLFQYKEFTEDLKYFFYSQDRQEEISLRRSEKALNLENAQ